LTSSFFSFFLELAPEMGSLPKPNEFFIALGANKLVALTPLLL
jgi:hypothetical protein